jgi:Ca2+-transporting ATPase
MTVQVLDIAELAATEIHTLSKEDRQRTAVPEFNFTVESANLFIYQRPFEYLRPNTRTQAQLLTACALCNDSSIEVDPDATAPVNLIGDPTETALLMVAARFNIFKAAPVGYVPKDDTKPTDPLVLTAHLPRVAEVPFSSERKRMTTVHAINHDSLPTFAHTDDVDDAEHGQRRRPLLRDLQQEQYVAYSKGAADSMLSVCTHVLVRSGLRDIDMDDGFGMTYRERILQKDAELASEGQRVLGFAYRKLNALPEKVNVDSIETDMVFVGLVGMIDPPRPEVREAVIKCRTAGIRPVMITGDHPQTALAIAEELGITRNRRVKTGRDLEIMSEAELDALVPPPTPPQDDEDYVSVFARVSPEHKLRIVEAFQRKGHIVAMTGDGVNDAPALKRADIGVAMGITGTAVSKEASSMVILDDNFATIVDAAEEGRTIYDNVRKFIKYILGSNIGEVGVLFVTQLLGLPLPLNTLQILWMNLVTDGLPALALSVEKGESNSMQRPPFNPKESIFSRGLGSYLVKAGIFIGLIALATALLIPVQRVDGSSISYLSQFLSAGVVAEVSEFGARQWSTMMFTVLVFVQMGHALAVRSQGFIWKISYFSNPAVLGAIALTVVLQIGLVYLPFAQDFFGTVALSADQFLISIMLAVFTYAGFEAAKIRRNSR